MIITKDIKDLVAQIEEEEQISTKTSKKLDHLQARLVNALHTSCLENSARYKQDHASNSQIGTYPTDHEGYAIAFDPIEDEEAFWDTWSRYGIFVGQEIVSDALRTKAIERIQDIFNTLSNGAFDVFDPATYDAIPTDKNGTSLISRGFLEIYHDDICAQMRQTVRGYVHHALIWGDARLWTSFDRLGVKLPSQNHEGGKALPLHVDQNPRFDPHFKTLQGVLALADCPLERGTYRGVPGSRGYFNHYAEMPNGKGEFVELSQDHAISPVLNSHAQALPLRAGDLVSWDSRTTHANTDNTSSSPRFVFYTATGKAAEGHERALDARQDAFQRGVATSPLKVPEALLRASIKPRFTDEEKLQTIRQPEQQNLLGELLYGSRRYADVLAKTTP